jgi:prepilin signal peptidase PulO-like enzyme (type II secretory pathway)
MWSIALAVIFGACAISITFFDLKELWIPDALSLGGLAAVLLLRIIPLGTQPLPVLAGSLIGFAVPWALHAATAGRLGLGDAKYSALIAAYLGFPAWCVALFVASTAGLACGLLLAGMGRLRRSPPIPFAPFLTLGAVVAAALSPLLGAVP